MSTFLCTLQIKYRCDIVLFNSVVHNSVVISFHDICTNDLKQEQNQSPQKRSFALYSLDEM